MTVLVDHMTMAERTRAEFYTATKTISVSTIARRYGASTSRDWLGIIHTFPDKSVLLVFGRGRNHKVMVK